MSYSNKKKACRRSFALLLAMGGLVSLSPQSFAKEDISIAVTDEDFDAYKLNDLSAKDGKIIVNRIFGDIMGSNGSNTTHDMYVSLKTELEPADKTAINNYMMRIGNLRSEFDEVYKMNPNNKDIIVNYGKKAFAYKKLFSNEIIRLQKLKSEKDLKHNQDLDHDRALHESIKRLEAKSASLKKEIAKYETEKKALSDSIILLKSESNKLKANVDKSKKDLSDVKTNLEKVQKDLTEAEKKLDNTPSTPNNSSEITSLKNEISRLKNESDKAKKDLSDAKSNLSKAQKNLEESKKNIAKLEKMLEESKKDTSKEEKPVEKENKDDRKDSKIIVDWAKIEDIAKPIKDLGNPSEKDEVSDDKKEEPKEEEDEKVSDNKKDEEISDNEKDEEKPSEETIPSEDEKDEKNDKEASDEKPAESSNEEIKPSENIRPSDNKNESNKDVKESDKKESVIGPSKSNEIKRVVNKKALNEAISKLDKIELKDLTKEGKDLVLSLKTKAVNLNNKADASQEEVNSIVKEINKLDLSKYKINASLKAVDEKKVSKKDLEKMINELNGLDKSKLTEDQKYKVELLQSKAIDLFNRDNTTEEEIKEILKQYDNLKKELHLEVDDKGNLTSESVNKDGKGTLPQTGQNILLALLGIGSLALGSFAVFKSRKKKA